MFTYGNWLVGDCKQSLLYFYPVSPNVVYKSWQIFEMQRKL
ncbi:hypothetical protein SAMN04488121_101375 [Chitinophaga filiformis]|uniref:Uncharacterized protein n=1 Tax=Chitinophaga filiformis TaxID=104663 RepID=A0A1G7H9Y2_CHIFI|nr:hypothetical protein SAMN04488121_101375 [Chitinophaga filiformis]